MNTKLFAAVVLVGASLGMAGCSAATNVPADAAEGTGSDGNSNTTPADANTTPDAAVTVDADSGVTPDAAQPPKDAGKDAIKDVMVHDGDTGWHTTK